MKKVFYFLCVILLAYCKENPKPLLAENFSSTVTDYKKQVQNQWYVVELKNFKFKIPSHLKLDKNVSSSNKKVYRSKNDEIGLTIDFSLLPENYKNSEIGDIINNLDDFGTSINNENNRYFDDFKLMSTKNSYLGNKKSVVVNQTSSKISVSNSTSVVNSHFVISSPYYLSVSFFYPKNSYKDKQLFDEIEASFSF